MPKKREPRLREPTDQYFKTPFNVIDTPEWEQLSASARYLFYHLWYLFNKHAWREGYFSHSDNQIAQEMKRNRKTIWLARQELVKHGFISYTYNKNHNSNNTSKLSGRYYMLGALTAFKEDNKPTVEEYKDPWDEPVDNKPEFTIPDFTD